MKKRLCLISFMLIVACMLSACNRDAAHSSNSSAEDSAVLSSGAALHTTLLAAKEATSDSASAESETPITNAEGSASRMSLVDSFLQNIQGDHVMQEKDAYEILGEVGDYTLVRIDIGGDCAIVMNVYGGYQIFSPTIGYPSETHLYLISDRAIFTLNAAYEQGLIGDMGEVYHLLPKTYQAGYDPSIANSYTNACRENAFGFQNGVLYVK